MIYDTFTECGQTFTNITGLIRQGDNARKFIITEAWNGGFVAYTADGGKQISTQGETVLQAWRKLRRMLEN